MYHIHVPPNSTIGDPQHKRTWSSAGFDERAKQLGVGVRLSAFEDCGSCGYLPYSWMKILSRLTAMRENNIRKKMDLS